MNQYDINRKMARKTARIAFPTYGRVFNGRERLKAYLEDVNKHNVFESVYAGEVDSMSIWLVRHWLEQFGLISYEESW